MNSSFFYMFQLLTKSERKMETKQNDYSATAFADFTKEDVSLLPFENLIPGWHKVKVSMAIFTNDFMTGLRNPVMKSADKLPTGWTDPTYQLAVYFEGENHKGATRRFTRYGYWKFDELAKADPKLAAECTSEGEQGYAVDKTDKVRMISDEATRKAGLILNRFLTAAGVPAGTPGDKLLETIKGVEMLVEIGARVYKGEIYTDIVNFADANTPAEELKRIPKPEGVMDHLPATQPA
jgi:hypothetical protein